MSLALIVPMPREFLQQDWLDFLEDVRSLSHNVASHGRNLSCHHQTVVDLEHDLRNLAAMSTILQEQSRSLDFLIREMKSVIDSCDPLLYDKSHGGS